MQSLVGINPLILERNKKRNTFTDRRMPEKSDQNSSLELTAEVRKKVLELGDMNLYHNLPTDVSH